LLAWLTFKPQLAAIILFGVLLWAAWRRRWHILTGFALGLLVLCGLSFIFLPTWPAELLAGFGTPLPTDAEPGIGSTWLLFLRAVGLNGVLLVLAYLALAAPFLAALVWAAGRQTLIDVIALGCLAAFFITPYCQAYDFTILVIPVMVLLNGQPTR